MPIVPIPIFIYRDKKSDKELREEMKWEYRVWKAEQEELARRRERERKEQERKEQERLAEEKRINDEYYEARKANPWDYYFLPEGWSFFGQCVITPIDWDGKDGEFEFLSK
jgi:hypothetical protein